MLQQTQLFTHKLLRAGIDFLYPPCCPICLHEDTLNAREMHHNSWLPRLCQACEQQTLPNPAAYCPKCGASVGPHLNSTQGCIHCKKDCFVFAAVYALGNYEGPLKNITLQAKQPNGFIYAATLAQHLWSRHATTLQQAMIDCIVPVPKHWTQSIGQRYDCPVTLAKSLGTLLSVPVFNNRLIKCRRTPKQSSLPVSKRRVNLKRAFRPRGILSGQHVLLVDDILTTGATAQESAKALQQCGAGRISVAVIARGIGL